MLVRFQYILVVLAKDNIGRDVDPPMEIQVLVEDVNDNAPICQEEESIFELQEGEPVGKMCHGSFMVCSVLHVASVNIKFIFYSRI